MSRNTCLRLLRRLPVPSLATPQVLGVDDWAYRKGRTYGTILMDLERSRPVALRHDREAGTLTQWLQAHPGVEIMARDRSKASADGARQGAPEAPPRRPRSRTACTCGSMSLRPSSRCAVRMARRSRRAMRRCVRPRSAKRMVLWPFPSHRPHPRRRLKNLPPSAGRDGWPSMRRCGRYSARGTRARPSPGSWAGAGRRCFATSMRRPFLHGRGALIAARVSSTLIRTPWSSAGMRVAVTPARCVRNSVNGAIAAVILPSPARPNACVRLRGWHPASA